MFAGKVDVYVEWIGSKYISSSCGYAVPEGLDVCVGEDGRTIAGQVERVGEFERFEGGAEGECMFFEEHVEIIGDLEGVLVKDIIDREGFMTGDDIA